MSEVVSEISPAGLGNFNFLYDDLVFGLVFDAFEGAFDVLSGTPDVPLDIEGESRGLRDSQTEVKSHTGGYATETDQQTPGGVDMSEYSWVVA